MEGRCGVERGFLALPTPLGVSQALVAATVPSHLEVLRVEAERISPGCPADPASALQARGQAFILWGGGGRQAPAWKEVKGPGPRAQRGFPGDLAFPAWASPEMLRLPKVPAEGLPDGPAESPQDLGAQAFLSPSSLPLLWS